MIEQFLFFINALKLLLVNSSFWILITHIGVQAYITNQATGRDDPPVPLPFVGQGSRLGGTVEYEEQRLSAIKETENSAEDKGSSFMNKFEILISLVLIYHLRDILVIIIHFIGIFLQIIIFGIINHYLLLKYYYPNHR